MALQGNKKFLAKISVFEAGNERAMKTIKVKKADSSCPPTKLFMVSPESKGSYPVVVFCHGYCTQMSWYSQLLQHISSHGYIVVAPQFYKCLLMCFNDEIKTAAKVTNWLPAGLPLLLPEGVEPDFSKLALVGHSRGGKKAFGLALGHAQTSLKFKAILAIDPVSGPTPPLWNEPKILSYIPQSFHLSVPVGVIGTGLSNQYKGMIIPPLGPDGFNHSEFFNESKPPCCYFLAKDYGHCDILDDSKVGLASLVCRSGKGSKEKMRRGVGGIVVAFLKAYLNLGGDACEDDLQSIVDSPAIAPITLDPVIYVKK